MNQIHFYKFIKINLNFSKIPKSQFRKHMWAVPGQTRYVNQTPIFSKYFWDNKTYSDENFLQFQESQIYICLWKSERQKRIINLYKKQIANLVASKIYCFFCYNFLIIQVFFWKFNEDACERSTVWLYMCFDT